MVTPPLSGTILAGVTRDTLIDRTAYKDLSYRRKEDDNRYLTLLQAGLRSRRLLLPSGLQSGQKLRFLLQSYLIPVAGVRDFAKLAIWISGLMFVALACPNTLQILSRYEPALGVKPQPHRQGIGQILEWKASLPWAIVVSGIAAVAIASINGPSEFLYWQF